MTGKAQGMTGKNREFSYEQVFLEPVVYVETPLKKNNYVDCKISQRVIYIVLLLTHTYIHVYAHA